MTTKNQKCRHISDDNIQIINMSWERIFLNVDAVVKYSERPAFILARITFPTQDIKYDATYNGPTQDIPAVVLEEVQVTPTSIDGVNYHFHINMSLVDRDSFLENGRWFFMTRLEGDPAIHLASVSYDMSYKLADMDKIYIYGKYKYAYNVHFTTLCFDAEHIIPVLNSRFMIENPHWKDTYVIKERRTFKGRYRCTLKKFKLWLLQAIYNIYEKGNKHDGKHVLLMSETKPYLWGNLKYIDERIKSRGLDKDLVVDHSFRIAVGKNNSALNWFHVMKRLARQDYIFVDDFAPLFSSLDLSPRTKLVQVWHAGEGFKAVGYGRFGSPNSPHPTENCHRKYDYVITGSRRLAEVYSEVFGQPLDHILPVGMARLDNYLDADVVTAKTDAFYAAHPECTGKKLILFAPTYRGTNQKTAYYPYEQLDFDAIYDFCGDEYIWAFKMHPFVKRKPPIREAHSDRIIDLSSVKDINDLYYVADMLITDYSSAYYEYALLRKPILFFTYDRVVYEITRGVHKGILETAPGKVCDTFDELMQALHAGDYDMEKTIEFSEANFGEYDSKATDRIIDTIILGEDRD